MTVTKFLEQYPYLVIPVAAVVGSLVLLAVVLRLRKAVWRSSSSSLLEEDYSCSRSESNGSCHRDSNCSSGSSASSSRRLSVIPLKAFPTTTRSVVVNDKKCFSLSESESSRSSRDSTATGIGVPVTPFIEKIRRVSASSSCSVHHDRRHSFSPEFSSSPEDSVCDDLPSLTISLKKLEDVVNEDKTSDTNIGILFVRAENLKRALNSSLMAENLSQLKSYLKTKGSQRKRRFSGVFARIFSSKRIEETTGTTLGSPAELSCNSGDDDARKRRQETREELLLETAVHTNHSCSNSIIDFTWNEVILKASDFPVRLSLYDVDRNKVRICLGHALLSRKFLQQQFSSQGIITGNEVVSTHILHPTISSASISPNEGENNEHLMQQ